MTEALSIEQGKLLLRMARRAIAEKLALHSQEEGDTRQEERGFLDENRGLFVTLHQSGRLRGCIGTIEPVSRLSHAVTENAQHAAFRDSRFSPLTADEFDRIDIEVSILSPPEPLSYADPGELAALLTPGVDGVVLKKGFRKATFLPQVWEQLPRADAFLSQLCLKAGLDRDAWKHDLLEIFTYRVQSFEEDGFQ